MENYKESPEHIPEYVIEPKILDIKALEAENVIKNYVLLSVGAGLIPVPFLDVVVITGIQLKMVKRLATVYGQHFPDELIKSAIIALIASFLPVYFSDKFIHAIRLIPIIGPTAANMTLSVTAGAATYAVGKVFQSHFESGRVQLKFDHLQFAAYFRDKFKEGKNYVARLRKQPYPID